MSHKRNQFTETPKDEQRTPPSLFKKLDDRFKFDCDAAATKDNALCDHYFGEDYTGAKEDALKFDWLKCSFQNGLSVSYPKVFYCNPPYSKGLIEKFTEKGYLESIKGATVVMLLPVDFSAARWDYCMEAAEWIRIKGRIHFNDMYGIPIKGSPLFDSCVVVFDTKLRNQRGLVVSEMDWR
jgi:phage N-6-adenine-methyltransferase